MELNPDDVVTLVRNVFDQILSEPNPMARARAVLTLRDFYAVEYPRLRNEAVYRLRDSGVANQDIAAMFGVNKHTAAHWTLAHSEATGLPDIRTIRRKTADLKAIKYVVE